MSWLRIYNENESTAPVFDSRDHTAIAQKLAEVGVRCEQWQAAVELAPDASDEDVMNAYKNDIERLKRENGYQAVDVLRVLPDNPNITTLRQKFLSEHRHSEDEVRFFVEGAGMFYLHIKGQVFVTLCERGDLIGVPDNTPHWFDTGITPHFTTIRFFTNPEGWVAKYSGDTIAQRFPTYEGAVTPTVAA